MAPPPSGSDLPALLIRAAVDGDETTVARLCTHDPVLRQASLAVAAALGDVGAATGWLAREPQHAIRPAGPLHWTPLLYASVARLHAGTPDNGARRAQLVNALHAHGANANDGVREMTSVRGWRSALGAAVGCARSVELARALLECGADISDGPTLYEGSALWEAVRHEDEACLRMLLGAQLSPWQLCHALPHALQFDSPAMVAALLTAGADPNWTMGADGFGGNCLHEALMLGRGTAMLELLIDGGAHIDFRDRDGVTPLAVATRLNDAAAIRLLRARGADRRALTTVDRWLGACVAQDAPRAAALNPGPKRRAQFTASDPLWLCRALRKNLAVGARLMLDGGLPANVADDDGEYPLHCAARHGEATMCAALIARGAAVEARNFAGRTALAVALDVVDDAARIATVATLRAHGARLERALSRSAQRGHGGSALLLFDANDDTLAQDFEAAADAVVAGDLDTLRDLLVREPVLATARSARPHRATLLHYLGANGVETERQKTPANAVAVAELLLNAGADPNALCYTYRGGPEQTTLGLLTSSDHPRRAGLTLPLVAVLARHDARLGPVLALLNLLYERQRAAAMQHDDRALTVTESTDTATTGLALVEATRLGELAVMKTLIAGGADVNAANAQGMTALHCAAIDGQRDLVTLLLEKGADPARRDSRFNGTAAGWADAGGHTELAALLAAAARPAP